METEKAISTEVTPYKNGVATLSIIFLLAVCAGGCGWFKLSSEHKEARRLPLDRVDFSQLKDGNWHGFGLSFSLFSSYAIEKEREIGIHGKRKRRMYLYAPNLDVGFWAYLEVNQEMEKSEVFLTKPEIQYEGYKLKMNNKYRVVEIIAELQRNIREKR